MGVMPDIYDEAARYRESCCKYKARIHQLEDENERLREQIKRLEHNADRMGTSYIHPLDLD